MPSANPVTMIISLLESASGTFNRSTQKIRKILAQEGVNDVDIIFKIKERSRMPRIDVGVDDTSLVRGALWSSSSRKTLTGNPSPLLASIESGPLRTSNHIQQPSTSGNSIQSSIR
jgi:hypothetical protein